MPKILILDIEIAPILAHVWGLWDQNVGLNQIHTDWYILSWAAKWLGEDDIYYMDQRDSKDIEDDSEILSHIWVLLDDADIIVTQNGKKFDQKKLFARFILNGMQPPSPFKHIDTMQIAKSVFGFTSNKLEYMTDKLCTNHKKLKHSKFPGFYLWKEVLQGNPVAWDEMKEYNIEDILSLEELYLKLRAWDKKHPNLNVYNDSEEMVCRCGSKHYHKRGFSYTNLGKYQCYRCSVCGASWKDGKNLLSKGKRDILDRNVG